VPSVNAEEQTKSLMDLEMDEIDLRHETIWESMMRVDPQDYKQALMSAGFHFNCGLSRSMPHAFLDDACS